MGGVVDFDPDNWRRGAAAEPAKVANPAKERPTLAALAGLADPPLPDELQRGLRWLREMPAPRMAQPKNWPGIVRDCLALASDGWAQDALWSAGWHPLNLWGVSPAAGGIANLEGLGIWLSGRRIIRIESTFCEVEGGPGARLFFPKRDMEGAVRIWEIGAGRG